MLAAIPRLSSLEYTLSVCAIFQDEARFLKEWIDYHRLVGVEHFRLYNNNSHDNYKQVLKPYIEEGIVELIEWPSIQEENDWFHFSFIVQTGAYNDAINNLKGVSKWLALIDTDEFIVPVCEDSVTEILEKHFSNVSGLCINWQCYGTSGIYKIGKNASMLRQLVYKAPQNHERNLFYKSIVQPLHVKECPNPHFCEYLDNHWHVNTNREAVVDQQTYRNILVDKLRINHYWTRDEYFLHKIKIPRYERWTSGAKQAVLNTANELNQEFDDCIIKILDRSKNTGE